MKVCTMQFGALLVLLAWAIEPVFGAVVAVAGQAEVAAVAGITGGLDVSFGEVTCRATDPKNRTMADIAPITREGYRHLDEPWRVCDLQKGHNGCGRVSCSWNSAIWICADQLQQDVPIMCTEVASMARRIVETCTNNDKVQGSIWDDDHIFRVEIFHDWC